MMVDGHQMTVIRHAVYLKVSYKDPFKIANVTLYLSSIYSEKLTLHHVKVHGFLGVGLYFSEKITKKVYMIKD